MKYGHANREADTTALCLAFKAPVIWPHQPLASIPGPMGIFIPVLLPSPLLELSPPFPTSIQSLLLQGPASVLSSPGKLYWPLQVQGVYLLCNLQHLLLTTQLGSKLQSWSCFLGTGFCPPTPPPSNPIILRLPGTNPGAKIGFLTDSQKGQRTRRTAGHRPNAPQAGLL